jgi:hypothetical protein
LRSIALAVVLGSVLALTGALANAQQPEAPAAPPQPPAGDQPPAAQPEAPPSLPPSAYAVGDPPPPVEKTYRKKPMKVFEALMSVLKEMEVPVETSDAATGYVKSQLLAFDYKRFYDVATPPPELTKERPIRQRVGLNSGWFSIEAQIARAKGGSHVTLQAYIEERAFNAKEGRMLHVQRWSNGRIEKYFYDKMDQALGVK